MKNRYFEIAEGVLNVRDGISPRNTIYGIGKFLLLFFVFVIAVLLICWLFKALSLDDILFYLKSPISIILFYLIPAIAFIIGHRFPSAAKVSFHFDTKTVKWQQQEHSLEVPFDKINFQTDRNLSKSGISSVSVSVSVIDSEPLFPTDPPKQNEDDRYVKILWAFYCSTQAEADEMIEIIKMFMDGKLDGSPSKFDDL